ncbi:MAG: acetoacetate--CoA ligase [Pseudomonadota bacterium]
MTDPIALWTPSKERSRSTNLARFMTEVENRHAVRCGDYSTLHEWSINNPESFWSLVWDFTGVIAAERGTTVIKHFDRMPGAQFFPQARLNFAQNLLRRRDDGVALIFRGEDGLTVSLTYGELYSRAARAATAMRDLGIRKGDRVAAITANIPQAIVAMLGAASIGAVWSSCSPDFGEQGILDRFEQIEPSALFAVNGYDYNGKTLDISTKVQNVAAQLSSVKHIVEINFRGAGQIAGAIGFEDFLGSERAADFEFEQVRFNHPLYILFSSGTTGKPKCIVHSAGGTLLQHLKEHRLHCDIRRDDRLFYFTTCGWMMWNWLASVLASEASALLYDGSPFYPDGLTLFDFAEQQACTHFGISAKFIQAVEKYGLKPADHYSLSNVRQILSTGSVLPPEGFDFVYQSIKSDVCLSSISGGTDIIGCFVGGNPTGPVHRGELQCRALGMATDVWNDQGEAVTAEKGELVCTQPFPSMPVGFWRDEDGTRFRAAYFERFEGTWAQGDYAEVTPSGGFIFYGRSDATLNPGGVRIGTAEIYRQVEVFDEVLECVAIGQEWQGDTRVVLFVVLQSGVDLDVDLTERLKREIRKGASPRHVPAKILQVRDIPRTRSGKLTELAIRDVVHGREVKNAEAIANPEAFADFKQRQELAE